MKTQEAVLEAVKNGTQWKRDGCNMLECRDYYRLVDYFPVANWLDFGLKLNDGLQPEDVNHSPKAWTEEEIKDRLMQQIRYLDKLVDELAKGKALDKVLRK